MTKTKKSSIDGLARRSPDSGVTGPTVATGFLRHPGRVALKVNSLQWEFVTEECRDVKPTPAMFEDFVSLWSGTPEDVLRFAKRWGPLRVDRNGRPLVRTNDYDYFHQQDTTQKKASKQWREGAESLDMWRFFSRRAHAVIQISKALEQGTKGKMEDWRLLSSPLSADYIAALAADPKLWHFPNTPYLKPQFYGMPDWSMREFDYKTERVFEMGVQDLKRQISGELSAWMHRYGVGLAVTWDQNPQIEIRYRSGANVLSAIALHLTLSVLGNSMYICSGCGRPYSRHRKRPKTGNQNYCDECAADTKEPNRLAQQRRRERLDRIKELAKAGMSAEQISNEIDWPAGKISRHLAMVTAK